MPLLEEALLNELIPSKKEIVRDNTESEIEDLINNSALILDARLQGMAGQLNELKGLRGKNSDVVVHMMSKVNADRVNFEQGLQRFQAVRSVFLQQSNKLFSHLGMDRLKVEVVNTRTAMINANFTKSIRAAMDNFFSDINRWMVESEAGVGEIRDMMDAMYHRYAQEHGTQLVKVQEFSTARYQKELARLERAYKEHFNTPLNMITNEKMTLTSKFFEMVAARVVNVYEVANRDVENWLKAVMAPMESQVREQQLQLRRRLESVKRIREATDSLEDRIAELESVEKDIMDQLADLKVIRQHIGNALAFDAQSVKDELAA